MTDSATPSSERSRLDKIIFSPDERRPRAGWRIATHTFFVLFMLACTSTILLLAVASFGSDANTQLSYDVVFLLNEISLVAAITGATFLTRRLVDRRTITSLGLLRDARTAWDLLAGIVIALVMLGSIFLAELALGWTRFDGFAWQSDAWGTLAASVLLWLASFIIGGWGEELLSRGYQLQNLAEGLNLFWGVLISSGVFALLHLANPGATWMSTLGILLAGLFLALPYLLTRQLWLSIGLHIGWNVFEGVVFGFPVSGIQTYHLLHHTVGGPLLWTGGEFGPEAGLLVVPALLLGALLVYGYTRPAIRDAISDKANPD